MPSSFLHSFAKPSSDAFINIVRGDMALLWDDKGNEYIDGIGSLWYCQIGHGRTEMADAVAAQISTLETYSTFDPFTNPLAEEVAEVIASLSPIPDSRVFLCGSGSESIDSAMKIARTSQIQSGHAVGFARGSTAPRATADWAAAPKVVALARTACETC